MRRVAIIASASGCGETAGGEELATRLDVPLDELDTLNHQPAWVEAAASEPRSRVEPLVSGDSWMNDGGYWEKLRDLVLAGADTVVWLDLPVWLPQLLRPPVRRIVRREEVFGGRRETLRNAFVARTALVPYAARGFDRSPPGVSDETHTVRPRPAPLPG